MAKKANRSLSDFPEGMMTEVLIRLPVKSLLICKSVCKPWLSLISHPYFIKSHIHRALTTCQNDSTLLNIINVRRLAIAATTLKHAREIPAIFPPQPEQRRRQLVNQALEDANRQDLSRLHLQFDRLSLPHAFGGARFVSCCNGIICFSSYIAVFLWNPSINKFRELPFETSILGKPGSCFPVTIGFGYDNISNEYKLLRFVYNNRENVVPIVKVNYINADCCREIQGPILKTQIKRWSSHIAVKGVLYFDGGDQLVSFDLHDEVFGLIPFPNSIQRKMSDVMDFQGSVAMVFESGPGVNLWTLDNVSAKLSWTKNFSIEYGLNDLDTDIWLACYLGSKQFYGRKLLNGKLIVCEILYDHEKKETKYYGLREEYVSMYLTANGSWRAGLATLNDSFNVVLRYTQTLVSLNGFEEVKMP